MSGITRYGSYLPYFRLQRAAIGAGRGERSVASYDEDAVSMSVEAARDAGRGGAEIDTLIFATTSPPYAEKLNAATLQAALDLPETGALARAGQLVAYGPRRPAARRRRGRRGRTRAGVRGRRRRRRARRRDERARAETARSPS